MELTRSTVLTVKRRGVQSVDRLFPGSPIILGLTFVSPCAPIVRKWVFRTFLNADASCGNCVLFVGTAVLFPLPSASGKDHQQSAADLAVGDNPLPYPDRHRAPTGSPRRTLLKYLWLTVSRTSLARIQRGGG